MNNFSERKFNKKTSRYLTRNNWVKINLERIQSEKLQFSYQLDKNPFFHLKKDSKK